MIAIAARLPLVLAAAPPTNDQPGGQGQEFGSSSPIALVVIILLLIGVVFLGYSMAKHLKKVPKSFDPEEAAALEAEAAALADSEDAPEHSEGAPSGHSEKAEPKA